MKDIAILLPYKENFTEKSAGAASIWVKDYLRISKLTDKTTIYGNLSKSEKPITNNFRNISINKIFLKKNLYYTKKFYENCIKFNHRIIEIHNRPESLHYFIEKKKIMVLNLFLCSITTPWN